MREVYTRLTSASDFLYFRNSKIEFFQKLLQRFVVLKRTQIIKIAFWKIFQNGGAIQDGRFLTFYFQKIAKNQRVKFFPICKLIYIQKYLYFMAKIHNLWKNPKWPPKTKMAIFFNFFIKNSIVMPPSWLSWKTLLMQICK